MSSDVPLLAGGYADVYQGIWTSPEGKTIEVAVKTLRASRPSSVTNDTAALKKRIDIRMKRETLVWTRAKHRNIHTLLGFRSQPEPQLVSPWCRHGNLIDYLITNPELSTVDKLRLIFQAGRGLAYLHSQTPPMCHADIKPENVLVNDSKEAALSDFGLSRVLQSLDTRTGLTTSGGARGTHHYMAMELFAEDTPRATCESDVYAFGGLILRVMSGKAPFEGVPPGMVLLKVMQGKQPETQSHPTFPSSDPLWGLMRKCWDSDPKKRPPMSVVVAELEKEVERRTVVTTTP
ncbi:hypothetical protein M407DRAFT_122865 [Tulasnella calospora MUT 4182]|uniref:Protein kinase domain-containing protein n=1 Tax=Tulasnella calospora MUT 4182 TaxID=1051891 RepID=A0A0C3QBX9_9AGAM|nr:hypothetical protein M407DRAFT_122865 [Tulasnella calospora MUT 4182]